MLQLMMIIIIIIPVTIGALGMIKKEHNTLKNPWRYQRTKNAKNCLDKYNPHTPKNFVDVTLVMGS